MSIPTDSLTIFGSIIVHGHITSYHLITFLLQGYNSIFHIIITPSWNIHSILVVIAHSVVGSIVNREQCLKCQAINELVHVIDNTGIKLELTANTLCLTTKIAVSNGIRLVCLRTSREVFSVKQVERLTQCRKSHCSIWIDHIYRNQWSSIFREVWTHCRSSTPEITLILVDIVEGCTGICKTLNNLVDNKVNITTDTETVCIVILGITKVQQVFQTIVVNVRIEVSTFTTTLNLNCGIRTVINLSNIFVRIIVHIGIAVRINTCRMVVNILLSIFGWLTIVGKSLIKKCHVLCRTQILRELLCDIKTSIGIGLNLKTINLSAFGSNHDSTLGPLGTIKYHSLSTL